MTYPVFPVPLSQDDISSLEISSDAQAWCDPRGDTSISLESLPIADPLRVVANINNEIFLLPSFVVCTNIDECFKAVNYLTSIYETGYQYGYRHSTRDSDIQEALS